MEDRVDVVFGARVGELLAGVAEAKEAIESLRAPVESFIGGLSGIAEAANIHNSKSGTVWPDADSVLQPAE